MAPPSLVELRVPDPLPMSLMSAVPTMQLPAPPLPPQRLLLPPGLPEIVLASDGGSGVASKLSEQTVPDAGSCGAAVHDEAEVFAALCAEFGQSPPDLDSLWPGWCEDVTQALGQSSCGGSTGTGASDASAPTRAGALLGRSESLLKRRRACVSELSPSAQARDHAAALLLSLNSVGGAWLVFL